MSYLFEIWFVQFSLLLLQSCFCHFGWVFTYVNPLNLESLSTLLPRINFNFRIGFFPDTFHWIRVKENQSISWYKLFPALKILIRSLLDCYSSISTFEFTDHHHSFSSSVPVVSHRFHQHYFQRTIQSTPKFSPKAYFCVESVFARN